MVPVSSAQYSIQSSLNNCMGSAIRNSLYLVHIVLLHTTQLSMGYSRRLLESLSLTHKHLSFWRGQLKAGSHGAFMVCMQRRHCHIACHSILQAYLSSNFVHASVNAASQKQLKYLYGKRAPLQTFHCVAEVSFAAKNSCNIAHSSPSDQTSAFTMYV